MRARLTSTPRLVRDNRATSRPSQVGWLKARRSSGRTLLVSEWSCFASRRGFDDRSHEARPLSRTTRMGSGCASSPAAPRLPPGWCGAAAQGTSHRRLERSRVGLVLRAVRAHVAAVPGRPDDAADRAPSPCPARVRPVCKSGIPDLQIRIPDFRGEQTC